MRSGASRATGWTLAETQHVRLYAEASESRAKELAIEFERKHQALAHVFADCPAVAANGVDEVVIFSAASDVEELAGAGYAGFYTPPRDGIAPIAGRVVMSSGVVGDTASDIFLHELTHRFAHACFPEAPAWLQEGLAETFEGMQLRDGMVVFGIPRFVVAEVAEIEARPLLGTRVVAMPARALPTATQLVGLSAEQFYDTDAQHSEASGREAVLGHYAGAWGLVHMLEVSADAELHRRFAFFLGDLRAAQVPAASAFATRFAGIDLDEALRSYLRNGNFVVQRLPFDPGPIFPPQTRSATPSAAHLLLAEVHLSSSHGDMAATAEHLRAVPRSADEYARAQLLLIGMSGGEATMAELAALGSTSSDDIDVLHARAFVSVRGGDREQMRSALGALARRGNLRPSDHQRLAELLLALGRPETALRHAAVAVAGVPGSWRALAIQARIALTLQRFELARRSLGAALLIASERSPTNVRELRALLEEVNARALIAVPEPSGAASKR